MAQIVTKEQVEIKFTWEEIKQLIVWSAKIQSRILDITTDDVVITEKQEILITKNKVHNGGKI